MIFIRMINNLDELCLGYDVKPVEDHSYRYNKQEEMEKLKIPDGTEMNNPLTLLPGREKSVPYLEKNTSTSTDGCTQCPA